MGRSQRNELYIEDPLLREMIKNFSVNVKTLRGKKGMTQAQLALSSKLAINTVAEIEQHRIENIRLSTVAALARILKVRPTVLLEKVQN